MEPVAEVETWRFVVATATLLSVFVAMVVLKLHRAVIVLAGACVVLALQVMPQEQLFDHVDVNVILLLIGMMIVVTILKRTGIFQFIAIKSAKLAGGDPLKLLVLFVIVTAVLSSFFDNVTTILLMSPITLLVCAEFRISPVPFLVTQVLASNLGGAATLVGDPPNIMIGSAANLSFSQFIVHLAPIAAVTTAGYALYLYLTFRKRVGYASAVVRARLAGMDEKKLITDKKLLKRGLLVVVFILLGFVFHDTLHLEAGTVALCGAAALLLLSGVDIIKILEELEWTTPLFFICLYIVVGAAYDVGLINRIGKFLFSFTSSSLFLSALLIMWFSSLLSSIVSAVPCAAMMIPIIKAFLSVNGIEDGSPFWWSLSLGCCFGGNATLLGNLANMVTAGVAEKSGHHITFLSFCRHSVPLTLSTLTVSSLYIYLRYFL